MSKVSMEILQKLSWRLSEEAEGARYYDPKTETFVGIPSEDLAQIVIDGPISLQVPVSYDADVMRPLNIAANAAGGITLRHLLQEVNGFYGNRPLSREEIQEYPDEGFTGHFKREALEKQESGHPVFYIDLMGDREYFDGIEENKLLLSP